MSAPSVLCPACGACNGEDSLLGALGRLFHYRCRQCGIDYSYQPQRGGYDDE